MNEAPGNKSGKEEIPAPAQKTEREVPLDTRLLSEAVIELNISRKNVGIYPPGISRLPKALIGHILFSRRCLKSALK